MWRLIVGMSLLAAVLPAYVRAAVEISLAPASTPEMAALSAEVRNELARIPEPELKQLELRVAIGVEAFREELAKDDRRPLIASYLTSTDFEDALHGRARPANVTAVFSNPDPLDQLALAELLLGRPAVGAFESPAVQSLTSRLDRAGVQLIPVRPRSDIDSLLRSAQTVDVVLVLPDASILNPANINHVVRSLYQRRSVLIGYSSALARVGSLASVYGSPRDIARSVADVVAQYAHKGTLPAPSFVSDISVVFNTQLARSLNIALPDEAATVRAIKQKREARRRP